MLLLGTNNWLPPSHWLCLLPKQDKAQASGCWGARPGSQAAAWFCCARSTTC